jgi:hypothetical protein
MSSSSHISRYSSSRFVRSIVLLGLGLLIISLSGCVYLRLLSLKKQFADFDRFVKIEVTDSFTAHFNKPVLYNKDIVTLSKLQPSSIEKHGDEENWTYHFKKLDSNNQPVVASDTDIYYVMRFNNKKLMRSLTLSPILMRIAPAEFLEMSLRSLGGAKVIKSKRQVHGNIDNLPKLNRQLPKRQEIIKHLGAPFSEEIVNDYLLVTYHYRLKSEPLPPKLEERRLSVTKLYFDAKTDEMVRVYGRFAGLKLSIDYRKMIAKELEQTD